MRGFVDREQQTEETCQRDDDARVGAFLAMEIMAVKALNAKVMPNSR